MTKKTFEINEIMSLIPHRYPFLLIDRVLECDLNKNEITGIKNVTINEPQFTGHFPENPVMPGVLIIEAMAQLSCILPAQSVSNVKTKEIFFMSISNVKFRKVVTPGDTMVLHARIIHNRGSVWKFVAKTSVNQDIVAEAEFTAMMRTKNNK